MTNDAFASNSRFARTSSGNDELLRPVNALSVPQRKLLLALQPGADFGTLVEGGPAIEHDRRARDLQRLIELHLVVPVDRDGQPVTVAPARPGAEALSRFGGGGAMPPTVASTTRAAVEPHRRADVAAPGESTGLSPARRGPTIAIVASAAALIVGGASYWLLHVGEGATAAGKATQKAQAAEIAANAPTATAAPSPADASTATVIAVAAPSTALPTAPKPATTAAAPITRGVTAAAPTPTVTPAATISSPTSTAKTPSSAPVLVVAPTVPPSEAGAPRKSDSPAVPTAPAGVQPAVPAAPVNVQAAAPAPRADPPAPAPVTMPAGPEATRAAAASVPSTSAVSASAQQSPPSSVAPTLASAAPTASPAVTAAPPPAAPKVLARVTPEFPREAVIAGVTSGTVKARLRVAADGSVSAVEILAANPVRVFDRAVTRALSQWKFEPTGAVRTVDHEVEFR